MSDTNVNTALAPAGPKRNAAQSTYGSGRQTSAGAQLAASSLLKAKTVAMASPAERNTASNTRCGLACLADDRRIADHVTIAGTTTRSAVMFEKRRVAQTWK